MDRLPVAADAAQAAQREVGASGDAERIVTVQLVSEMLGGVRQVEGMAPRVNAADNAATQV